MFFPVAHAQFSSGAANQVPLNATPLPVLILFVINTALFLAAVVALGFIVWGGFKYMIARGDEREVETAKGILVGAIFGLVVIGIAAAIVNFVIGAVI